MNNVALFAVGSFVTLLVAAAMALLVFAAILDGRDEAERRALETEETAGEDGRSLRVVDAA